MGRAPGTGDRGIKVARHKGASWDSMARAEGDGLSSRLRVFSVHMVIHSFFTWYPAFKKVKTEVTRSLKS